MSGMHLLINIKICVLIENFLRSSEKLKNCKNCSKHNRINVELTCFKAVLIDKYILKKKEFSDINKSIFAEKVFNE